MSLQPDPKPIALAADELPRLTAQLQAAASLAITLVPEIPSKPGYTAPAPLPGRYTHQPVRDVDLGTVQGSLPQLDRVLAVVHDVAVLAFQSWVDRLAGRSAEEHSENSALAQLVTERSVQFGLGLYFERDGILRRVSLYARDFPAHAKLSDSMRKAGKIVVTAVDDESDPEGTAVFRNSYQLSALSLFPPLIVARTAGEARAIRQQRAKHEPTTSPGN